MTEERFAELTAENAELRRRIVEVENQLIDADFSAKMRVASAEYIRADERKRVATLLDAMDYDGIKEWIKSTGPEQPEQYVELVAENAKLRKRRDDLLAENNRLVEERRALVGLSHAECYNLARVAYNAWQRSGGLEAQWEIVSDASKQRWLSEACAVVVAVRARVRAQERQAIIEMLGGGDAAAGDQ